MSCCIHAAMNAMAFKIQQVECIVCVLLFQYLLCDTINTMSYQVQTYLWYIHPCHKNLFSFQFYFHSESFPTIKTNLLEVCYSVLSCYHSTYGSIIFSQKKIEGGKLIYLILQQQVYQSVYKVTPGRKN